MEYLKIQNNGLLPIDLISLMGGTTKLNNQFKIGQFGTGMKYTLAWLLRNNIDFQMFVGTKRIKIDLKTITIKDNNFDVIYIDNEKTSITTNMGMEWEGWMIIRELWCNALDEGGQAFSLVHNSHLEGKENSTTFYIQATGEIKDTVDNWNNYFIHERIPIYENDKIAFYDGGEELRIYKRGVLIHKKELDEGEKALFSYDIKNASINELREYKGYAPSDIPKMILECKDEKVVQVFFDSLNENCYEWSLDYNWFVEPSEAFKEVIGENKIAKKKTYEYLKEKGVEIDIKPMILPDSLYDQLNSKITNISFTRSNSELGDFYEQHDEECIDKLNEILAILDVCGYEIAPRLTFRFGIFGNKSTLGRINMDTKEVCLSSSLKKMDRFTFISIVIEENEHFNSGQHDCTRGFQTHILNLFVKQLLDKNEVKL